MTFDLRPSGSSIWTACSASVRFGAQCAEPPTGDPALQGQAAAWVGEMVLNDHVFTAKDLLGETYENGWVVDAEMCRHVQSYVDAIRKRGGEITAEKFVRLSDTIAGTLDCSATVRGADLFIDDLKYGFGVVEPYRNTQIGIYGAARYKELMNQTAIERVHLSIYQPRYTHEHGPHRTWTVTPDELMQNADWIIQRGELCQDPNSVASVGEHCKHCKARASCQALSSTLGKFYELVESRAQVHIEPDKIGEEFAFLKLMEKLLEARLSGVEVSTEQHIKSGGFVKNYHMPERLGRRKVVQKPDVVLAVTGVDPYKKVLRSPKELEDAGATPQSVKAVSERPKLARKIAKLDPLHAEREFSMLQSKRS